MRVLPEFVIDGRRFVVRPALPFPGDGEGRPPPAGREDGVVGEITVDRERYVIVEKGTRRGNSGCGAVESPLDLLTERELQIVMMVADGRVNKQIADRLHISEWTVSTHMRRIFAKLGVDSRAAMVYRCLNIMEVPTPRSRNSCRATD